MLARKTWLHRAARFGRETDGSSTIEAVIWIPMLALLLVLITDVSFVFYGRATAMRIVQDGNRAFSVGRITTAEDTQVFILNALAGLAPHATASTTLLNGVISTVVTLPVDDLMAIGTFPGMSGFTIGVSSQHLLES